MKKDLVSEPASQDEITLFCYMGEALCKIQIVEQALSHSIVLKTHSTVTKEEADEVLEVNRTYTLGRAIRLALKENLYSTDLQNDLNNFLDKRNWLVHKAIEEMSNGIYIETKNEKLLQKISAISTEALHLQHAIEMDMIDFCTARGRDMSGSLAIVNTRYS